MRILIIGDMHLKKANIDVCTKVLDKCAILASKCDLTVFTGDLMDGKASIRSEALRLAMERFSVWPHKVIIYLGNHDYENSMDCDRHSLEALKFVKNVEIVDKPTLITLNNLQRAYFIPYLPEDRFLQVPLVDADYCFVHQDFTWAKYSVQSSPIEGKIGSEHFNKYKRVFGGHIHLPQDFGNMHLVGTPYTESFKESDEKKRVIVYDTATDKVMDIAIGARQHVTFDYTIGSLSDIAGIKADLKAKIKPSNIVRLRITLPEEIEHLVKRSTFAEFDLSFKTNVLPTANKAIQINDTMSNQEMMEVYLKQLNLKPRILARVLATNQEILGSLQ